jgi:hypothetical protein
MGGWPYARLCRFDASGSIEREPNPRDSNPFIRHVRWPDVTAAVTVSESDSDSCDGVVILGLGKLLEAPTQGTRSLTLVPGRGLVKPVAGCVC